MVDQRIIETVKKYITLIPQDLGLKKVFLFGSFVKGKAKEESDIDVALVIENLSDFFYVQQQLMKLRRKIDLRIEPHPIDIKDFNADNPFVAEITKSGIEIFLN